MIKDVFGHEYTRIIKDPTFETRLKNFDPNLRLLFDQTDKKFKILEPLRDGSGGWSIVLSLQPNEELDDYILSLLWERRKNYQEKIAKNPSRWYDSFLAESASVRKKMDDESSQNHKYRLMDDRVSWRKAARELRNFPVSDVTAGYRKIEHKPKGVICVSK